MLKKLLLSEKGIALLTALIFNLVTLLLGVAWLKFSVNSALSTTQIRIERTQNDYLLKGFNSLIDIQATSMNFFKTKYLADFEVPYKPSQFLPKFESIKNLNRVVLEVSQNGNFENYIVRSKIGKKGEKVTSLKADNFLGCENLASFLHLTDCERRRQEFVPPDSTDLIFENCADSQQFSLLKGPNRFDGNFHTNDFVFFGAPPNVTMLGCATASGSYTVPPPIYQGSLMFPPPPLAGVNFINSCNSAGVITRRKRIEFGEFPESLIRNALQGGFYSSKTFENQVQRIVFNNKGFKTYSANKLLLDTFGPNAWLDEKQFQLPQNGAIFIETDVYVSGFLNGDVTVGSCGNIFIDNDLKYSNIESLASPSDVFLGSRLGLISTKNVLLETRHIATNKGYSWSNFDSTYAHNNHQEGVIINAGILALGESFSVFSVDFPNFERFPGDEFGGTQNPKFPLIGNHGTVSFFGSIAQKRRGIINNGTRGGYGGTLLGTGATVPQMVRIYDERFYCTPPRYFPKLERNLSLVIK
ncbi:MAG: hypothetical protein DWQ06_13040 [Calditrichaeota bacterium]|nr:MAG: hypothetical protein DWQ06_13040 [Calditrichota bacterium]